MVALLLILMENIFKLTTRGSVRDTSYTAFHRDRDKQISGVWEPSTWVDVVLPIARYAALVAHGVKDFSTSTDMQALTCPLTIILCILGMEGSRRANLR